MRSELDVAGLSPITGHNSAICGTGAMVFHASTGQYGNTWEGRRAMCVVLKIEPLFSWLQIDRQAEKASKHTQSIQQCDQNTNNVPQTRRQRQQSHFPTLSSRFHERPNYDVQKRVALYEAS